MHAPLPIHTPQPVCQKSFLSFQSVGSRDCTQIILWAISPDPGVPPLCKNCVKIAHNAFLILSSLDKETESGNINSNPQFLMFVPNSCNSRLSWTSF